MKSPMIYVGAVTALAVLAVVGWRGLDAGGAAAGQLLAYRDSETVALGARLYEAHCASCHGAELQGAPDWRVPDADGYLPAPPHDATGHTWHHPDALLIDITTRGTAAVVGRGYQSQMPAFGEVLSEAEIAATLAFIKSTWPPEIIETHDEINRRNAEQ